MDERFKKIASLVGDPTRASILWTLLDGRAFTATELALSADTSPQNISMHIAKLVEAGLLVVEAQGRHRYYKFSRQEVAYAVESMANLMPHRPAPVERQRDEEQPVRHCRTCYDHLAGKVGVAMADGLLRQKMIREVGDGLELTGRGNGWLVEVGIPVEELRGQRRSFLRPCLDWSERRHHLAGSVAAALLQYMLDADWLRRTKNSRAVIVTGIGQKELYHHFKVNPAAL